MTLVVYWIVSAFAAFSVGIICGWVMKDRSDHGEIDKQFGNSAVDDYARSHEPGPVVSSPVLPQRSQHPQHPLIRSAPEIEDQYQGVVQRHVEKQVVPSGKAFGRMEYEDVGPDFLDKFLLKYFHSIVITSDGGHAGSQWSKFCMMNPWAKGMPEVFWMMTGYRPDEYQLNSAISEYMRRVQLSKSVNQG